jgi:ABC-type sugar transport system permease subunit
MPYAFLLPAAIIIVLFRLLPIVAALGLSFFDANFGKIRDFVGLAQYERMFSDPLFWRSASNTVWFVVGAVPMSVAASLFFAMLLRRGVSALDARSACKSMMRKHRKISPNSYLNHPADWPK